MAYRPKPGDTDADRDVVCNIFNNGGTNPRRRGLHRPTRAENDRTRPAEEDEVGDEVKAEMKMDVRGGRGITISDLKSTNGQ